MTNFEFYKNDILNLIESGQVETLAVDNITGAPCNCDGFSSCSTCLLKDSIYSDCHMDFVKWLYQEYKRKAFLTPDDEKFLTFIIDEFYLARDKDGSLNLFLEEPYKVDDIWDTSGFCFEMDSFLFSFIKFNDEEPWNSLDLRTLPVNE